MSYIYGGMMKMKNIIMGALAFTLVACGSNDDNKTKVSCDPDYLSNAMAIALANDLGVKRKQINRAVVYCNNLETLKILSRYNEEVGSN